MGVFKRACCTVTCGAVQRYCSTLVLLERSSSWPNEIGAQFVNFFPISVLGHLRS